MTVSELIKKLSKLPGNIPVKAYEEDIIDYDDIVEVQHRFEEGYVVLNTQYGADNA